MLHGLDSLSWAGVCKRLENTIEQLFPQQLATRRCTSPFLLLSCSSPFLIDVLLGHCREPSLLMGTHVVAGHFWEMSWKRGQRTGNAQQRRSAPKEVCILLRLHLEVVDGNVYDQKFTTLIHKMLIAVLADVFAGENLAFAEVLETIHQLSQVAREGMGGASFGPG